MSNGKVEDFDFQYEKLPLFCYGCGKLGHGERDCPDGPYDEETLSYGSWLKASPWKQVKVKPRSREMETARNLKEVEEASKKEREDVSRLVEKLQAIALSLKTRKGKVCDEIAPAGLYMGGGNDMVMDLMEVSERDKDGSIHIMGSDCGVQQCCEPGSDKGGTGIGGDDQMANMGLEHPHDGVQVKQRGVNGEPCNKVGGRIYKSYTTKNSTKRKMMGHKGSELSTGVGGPNGGAKEKELKRPRGEDQVEEEEPIKKLKADAVAFLVEVEVGDTQPRRQQ